ncbi:MAG: FAD-dependent oxidoreductase, partial [Planctomycetota bacterium]
FPEIDYLGMKVAEHSGGEIVTDPGSVNRQCCNLELERTEQFIDDTFVFSKRRLVHQSVCMYSMTRDGHFVVDYHPDSEKIVFAAGFSGHGFKFAPVVAERLVGLLDQKEDPKLDFLKLENRQLVS